MGYARSVFTFIIKFVFINKKGGGYKRLLKWVLAAAATFYLCDPPRGTPVQGCWTGGGCPLVNEKTFLRLCLWPAAFALSPFLFRIFGLLPSALCPCCLSPFALANRSSNMFLGPWRDPKMFLGPWGEIPSTPQAISTPSQLVARRNSTTPLSHNTP